MSLTLGNESKSHSDLVKTTIGNVRYSIRHNQYAGHTAGLCDGKLQCNLVILPKEVADDFQRFCNENYTYCPLLATSLPGDPKFEELGGNLNLRTDIPLYFVYEDGRFVRAERDISSEWREDFVAFAIGCSFTFERALMSAGIPMRHVKENVTVPMFKTNRLSVPVGLFGGQTVVSMRPIKRTDIQVVREICAAYPHAHGEPVHVGDPAAIGITDLAKPDWGIPVSINDDEIPVFWGCGVTSQVAVINAHLDFCITHAPGAMLITEINEMQTFN